MWRTYWQLYRWRVLGHLAWTGLEIADRCVGAQQRLEGVSEAWGSSSRHQLPHKRPV